MNDIPVMVEHIQNTQTDSLSGIISAELEYSLDYKHDAKLQFHSKQMPDITFCLLCQTDKTCYVLEPQSNL